MITRQTHRPRRRGFIALLVLGLLATPLLLTQCRLVTDPSEGLPGVEYAPLSQRHKECTLKCDEQHRAAKAAALETHKLLIKGCGKDMACRRAEHDRYREAKKQIEETKRVCKFACRYNEGAVLGR